jgi:hypothetical protein
MEQVYCMNKFTYYIYRQINLANYGCKLRNMSKHNQINKEIL